MKEINYNEEEFKENAKKLAKKHDVPIEIMEQWLKESYKEVSEQFSRKLQGKKEKKKKQSDVKKILPDGTEWRCPFCETINKTLKCTGCDAFLDMDEKKK
jgi:rubrerythrin